MTQKRRLFFALEPDESVRKVIANFQTGLPVEGRAVTPAQFHITLAFLGMQSPDVIPALQSMAAGLRFNSCDLVLDQLGRFPRAGILWLGTEHVPAALSVFHQSLLDGLNQLGVDRDEKPWRLHLTLYRRLRMPSTIIPPVPISWTLNGFSLIESVSVPGGVEYHRLGHWKSR